MVPEQIFDIVFYMEIIGTIAFAASGAMVGIDRGMDVFGVCVLGVVTDDKRHDPREHTGCPGKTGLRPGRCRHRSAGLPRPVL